VRQYTLCALVARHCVLVWVANVATSDICAAIGGEGYAVRHLLVPT
jgi:hypothetical protein